MIDSEKLDRIYVCRQCGRSFLFRSDLDDHFGSSGHYEMKVIPLRQDEE